MSSLVLAVDATLSGFTNATTTTTSSPVDVRRANSFSVETRIAITTPSAKAFATTDVDVTANTITEPGHGFGTGLKGQMSTSGGLPGGLATSTDYYVIVVDADTYKVASSLVNALAGTAIDLTTQGTGTHTFTATSLAGGAIKVQKSNHPLALIDPANATWTDVAAATNVTDTTPYWVEIASPAYRAVRLHLTLTAGQITATPYVLVKEF